MDFKKAFSAFLIIFAMTLLTVNNEKNGQVKSFSANEPREWVNSPPVEFAPDGDRVSHYPPYHHPTQ